VIKSGSSAELVHQFEGPRLIDKRDFVEITFLGRPL
jgi:hypothetical protein